jgi:cytoskeletal protein CcmA (bactofilin family)
MAIFGKDKPAAVPAAAGGADHETAFFGTKLAVKGNVSGSGNVIMMGRLDGEVDLNGELVVAPPAVVKGDIKAANLTVSGRVGGSLTARGKIHLEKSAVVEGRMSAPRVSMADGASFNGEIEMKPPAQAPGKTKDTAAK